jgi:hypothetical protein
MMSLFVLLQHMVVVISILTLFLQRICFKESVVYQPHCAYSPKWCHGLEFYVNCFI